MKVIILTGGKSLRMGEDKAQTQLNGTSLVSHVYEAIKKQADEVIISGNYDYGLGLSVIPDLTFGPQGPVGALYSAWRTLKDEIGSEGFFTVPVDAPNLPHDLCERLYGDRCAIATAPDGTHQAFGWWRIDDLTRVFETLDLKKSVSLRFAAQKCEARQVHWVDQTLFYNINTPNDLSRYLTDIAPYI